VPTLSRPATTVLPFAVVLLAGCASVRLEGRAGPIEWRAVDLTVQRTSATGNVQNTYAFTLVLSERNGRALTIRRVETEVIQAGTTPGNPGGVRGPWLLATDGELRFQLSNHVSDGATANWPAWTVRVIYEDELGQPVSTTFDLALPPPSGSSRRARSVRPTI